jgi:hypothetical protein
LIAILQATVGRVKEQLGSDDPAFLKLQSSILRAVAELEIQKTKFEQGKTAKHKAANRD